MPWKGGRALGLGMLVYPMLMSENELIRMGVGHTGSEALWRLKRQKMELQAFPWVHVYVCTSLCAHTGGKGAAEGGILRV